MAAVPTAAVPTAAHGGCGSASASASTCSKPNHAVVPTARPEPGLEDLAREGVNPVHLEGTTGTLV